MNLSIIGTGKIVHEALPVIAATEGVVVRSIWCREHSLAKAQALAAQFGIPQVAKDYAAVLADPQVDTVYVALVNSAHFAYALQALQAGKNAILEKPACMSHRELARLAEEARGRGLMLFEAVTLLHLPAFHLLQTELLPQLGAIRHVECNYSQRSSRGHQYLHSPFRDCPLRQARFSSLLLPSRLQWRGFVGDGGDERAALPLYRS